MIREVTRHACPGLQDHIVVVATSNATPSGMSETLFSCRELSLGTPMINEPFFRHLQHLLLGHQPVGMTYV